MITSILLRNITNGPVNCQLRAPTAYEASHACAKRSRRAWHGADTSTQQGKADVPFSQGLPRHGQSARTGKRRSTPIESHANKAISQPIQLMTAS